MEIKDKEKDVALVELVQVTRRYVISGQTTLALDRVSVSVADGEFIAVVGASGSGKSTLLNVMAGIDRPTEGEAYILGQRVDNLSEDELARLRSKHVGIVFQFFQLLPTLTVLENVLLPMQLADVWHRPNHERALDLLELVGMVSHGHKLPSELSGGEKQRVAIARALANDPTVIFADEPTGNLDTATSSGILRILDRLNQTGKTIVLVTHETRLTASASRVLQMVDGRIASDCLQGGG